MPAGALVHCAVRVPCQWAAGLVNLRAETPKRCRFGRTTTQKQSCVGSIECCDDFIDGKCSTGAVLVSEPLFNQDVPAVSAQSLDNLLASMLGDLSVETSQEEQQVCRRLAAEKRKHAVKLVRAGGGDSDSDNAQAVQMVREAMQLEVRDQVANSAPS